ncbi:hypothetical protein AB0D99_29400 [Streptomyces sp. NPDC047971]|uniref:hypothetical protein n=1 Tax=Streptomyces sp. NPDC047971 TaxID=3154499 RepID=UPI0033F61369
MKRTTRANTWLGAASLALACTAGLLGGGTAQAAEEYPYTPADPKVLPGESCVTSGALPWIGNTDVSLALRVQGESATEGHPEARFVLRQGTDPEAAPLLDLTVPATVGGHATLRVPQERLPEGEGYRWQARLESRSGTSAWTVPCGFNIDRTRPATPTVAFTDTEQHPNGAPPGTVRTVRLSLPEGTEADHFCVSTDQTAVGCAPDQRVPVGAGGTATATFVTPEYTGPATIWARAVDRGGNVSDRASADYRITYPFIERFGDYDSDGRADLLGVAADGKLTLRSGLEGGGFRAPVVADGRNWSNARLARAGWLINRYGPREPNDVRNDIVALRDGKLFVYPGNGAGGFGEPVEITGYDWSGVTDIAVSRSESTQPMLLAKEGDRLLIFDLYTGGTYVGEPSVLAASGWASKTVHFSDGPADSGMPFFWARDTREGTLQYVPVEYGTTEMWALGTPTTVSPSGWTARQRPSVVTVGDLNGDGRSDLVSRERSGALLLHPTAEDGSTGTPVTLHAKGWKGVAFF